MPQPDPATRAQSPTTIGRRSRSLGQKRRAGREKRVLCDLPLVRSIAHRLCPRLRRAEFEDLISAGTVGLIEAVDRYDAERGVPFVSFAYPRIQGAILDELRSSGAFGAPRRGAADLEVVPIDSAAAGVDAQLSLIEVTEDRTSPAPGVHIELGELLDAVKQLPRRERAMLKLSTSGYTIRQIARLHGCSDSRASQLVAQARLRLEERTAA